MLYKRTYSIHLLLSIIIFINGCGNSISKNVAPVFTTNTAIKVLQDISGSERNIAANICLALKSKSENYKTSDLLGSKFSFEIKQNQCGIMSEINTVNTILGIKKTDNTFHYNASSPFTNDFAQTDTQGYLSQICNKINNNLAISNTTTLNGMTVQITFFKDTLEGYTVQYFNTGSNGISKLISAETFRIRTQITYTKGNILGMDEYYKKETICPTDSTKISEEEQTFISHQ